MTTPPTRRTLPAVGRSFPEEREDGSLSVGVRFLVEPDVANVLEELLRQKVAEWATLGISVETELSRLPEFEQLEPGMIQVRFDAPSYRTHWKDLMVDFTVAAERAAEAEGLFDIVADRLHQWSRRTPEDLR